MEPFSPCAAAKKRTFPISTCVVGRKIYPSLRILRMYNAAKTVGGVPSVA